MTSANTAETNVSRNIARMPLEVLPPEYPRFTAELRDYLARHDMVWAAPHGPPANWVQGAPLGNGDFGAMLYGYPDNLTFALGKTNLWVRRDRGSSNFPGGTFADCRRAYLDRDEKLFEELRSGKGKSVYDHNVSGSHFTGAGSFRLRLAEAAIAQECALRVALAEGTARLEFRQCGHNITADATYGEKSKASAFVARAPGVLVIRVDAGGIPLGHLQWELGRVRHPGLAMAAVGAEGNLGWLDQPLLEGDHYVIMGLVEGAAARWGVAGTRAFGECELDAVGAGLTIYLTVVSSRDAAEPQTEARRRLTAAQAAGYAALAAANREWWENYWRRSFVVFGDERVEKWWYVSNYLCGATLRAGAQSPGLQGVCKDWGQPSK